MATKKKRFVVSTDAIAGSRLARLGRARWKIEAFFKTIKYTFALRKAAQGTRLGMLRFLLLSMLSFVLAFASQARAASGGGDGLGRGSPASGARVLTYLACISFSR